MRVLMLGWELPPHNSGGLGVACYQMCQALAQTGADIDFIVPYKAQHNIEFMNVLAGDLTGEHQYPNYDAYDSQSWRSDNTPEQEINDQFAHYEKSVLNLTENTSYEIVHAHDWLTFRAALKAKEKLHCPLILHVHSIESDRAGGNPGNPFVREIEQTAMLIADHIVAVSELTKQKIIKEYFIPAKKIEVIFNSIDQAGIEPLDPDSAYSYLSILKSQGYKVVVNIGRLTIQKGLTNLLYAAQAVIRLEPKTIFLIVGSGDQYNELIELSANLGISKNVLFTGFLRGKEWRDAYGIADLFVLPSVSEPFGMTPLESIGYGTPALISRQSGVSEVIRNCLRVDFWDQNEMANKIVAVVRSKSLADELQQQSYKEFTQMSWAQAIDQLLDIYNHHIQELQTT